ncbi:MAG: hypothetical protein KZQ65_12555, partial [Candidatus Thiodiazotropha sp. (ex Gloverina cf. vestifex)]|nr:hypothetical protein [Candidatus Thiodiazotropha sp. (ex Gloverina cf. vestifex)]
TVTITAIQPRLRLSGTNRLGFQPSMAISGGTSLQFAARTGTRAPLLRFLLVLRPGWRRRALTR